MKALALATTLDATATVVWFVNDGPGKNEAPSATGTSRGALRFRAMGCNPARVDVTVEATVGGEFGDDGPIRVHGRIRGRR